MHAASLAQVTYVGVQKVDDQNEGKWRSQNDCWAQAERSVCPDFTKCEDRRSTSVQILYPQLPFSPGWWEHDIKIEVSCVQLLSLKTNNTREWHLHKRRLTPGLPMYRESTKVAILQLQPLSFAYLPPWQINGYSVHILLGYLLKHVNGIPFFFFSSIQKYHFDLCISN